MHFIHKILVYIPEAVEDKEIQSREELIEAVRDYADLITESYQDRVYDWRTTEDAGRWKYEYPLNVIFAKDDKKRFKDELDYIYSYQAGEIEQNLGVVNDIVGNDLRKIIQGFRAMKYRTDSKNGFDMSVASRLKLVVDMLYGEYIFECGFFNARDCEGRLYRGDIKQVMERPEDWALVMFDCHI